MRSRSLLLGVATALLGAGAALLVGACAAPTASRPARPGVGFGQPIGEADLAAWNIDIRTSAGRGLPTPRGRAGWATASEGGPRALARGGAIVGDSESAAELCEALRELRKHNSREWFMGNTARYESVARDPRERFSAALGPRLSTISSH